MDDDLQSSGFRTLEARGISAGQRADSYRVCEDWYEVR